ncbi:glycosyltransferase family 2 protein [Paenibacillus sp. NFR01]|uniref:glycosyltransferase n=1 Tax=Paenibacillus sp. NFR01 TaxID=1566279 RepID=UPI0008CE4332|nr:glycosyltransferase family A protein [Paenibacillus sp. NFR01]SEU13322.1 Glycosyltransferase, catalytic subunit of cellulose synthase and poly-beta-1,6-N-acetylglucosamine synthase [Paenibacillus sp. NFR01]
MIALLQGITGIIVLQLLFAVWNASRLPVLGAPPGEEAAEPEDTQPGKAPADSADAQHTEAPSASEGTRAPALSVLIPARDEAKNIAACLASVLACGTAGRRIEIIVLDDRSSDGTVELAAAAGGARTQVLAGAGLPEGWSGKCHACAQLAEAAGGEWLLFLDADIRLHPQALDAAMASAAAQGSGLITGFPRQLTGSWLERLAVPLMVFTIVCHLPIPLVRRSEDPRFAAAHGGFMLIHRDSYIRCGGHSAIRDQLVDDMALAKAVKLAGEPVTLADISAHTEMRMYHNASEVWKGYRKNIYAGLGRKPLLLLGVLLFYALLYVCPLIAALGALVTGDNTALLWAAAALVAGAAVKRTADRSGQQPLWFCLLLPASILSLIAIAAASWRGSISGKGYEWKGRQYP